MEKKEEQKPQVNIQVPQPQSKSGGKSSAGWIAGLIGIVVALFTIIGFSIRAWRMGRKIAKLQHEKDVAEEKKIQAEADKKVAELEEKKQKTEEEIRKHQEVIDSSQQKIDNMKKDREATIRKIEEALTWEDLDNLKK